MEAETGPADSDAAGDLDDCICDLGAIFRRIIDAPDIGYGDFSVTGGQD